MKLLVGRWNTVTDFSDLINLLLKIEPFGEIFTELEYLTYDSSGLYLAPSKSKIRITAGSCYFNEMVRQNKDLISVEKERLLMLTDTPITWKGLLNVDAKRLKDPDCKNRKVFRFEADGRALIEDEREPTLGCVSVQDYGIAACVAKSKFKTSLKDLEFMVRGLAETFGVYGYRHEGCMLSYKETDVTEGLCEDCVRRIRTYKPPKKVDPLVKELYETVE